MKIKKKFYFFVCLLVVAGCCFGCVSHSYGKITVKSADISSDILKAEADPNLYVASNTDYFYMTPYPDYKFDELTLSDEERLYYDSITINVVENSQPSEIIKFSANFPEHLPENFWYCRLLGLEKYSEGKWQPVSFSAESDYFYDYTNDVKMLQHRSNDDIREPGFSVEFEIDTTNLFKQLEPGQYRAVLFHLYGWQYSAFRVE